MKFSLVDGERREPEPGFAGQCPGCAQPVIAKCGTERVWHWAHKGKRVCDPWWEPETEWHRQWKNLFPREWQESVHRSPTGEIHIADIKTPNGLVIEFQHSSIKAAERQSREDFYRKMLWIVDCTRLKSDRPRINENHPGWHVLPEGIVQQVHVPGAYFPRMWLNCSVPVLFDFDGLGTEGASSQQSHLMCLLPSRFMEKALYFPVHRSTLVKIADGEAAIFDWQSVHEALFAQLIQPRYRLRYRRR
jgi:competence protein CoiA